MHNFVLSPIDPEKLMNSISDRVAEKVLAALRGEQPHPTTSTERPLTVDEAAEFLQLAKPTVYALVSQRSIPCKKKGNRLYFFKDELTEWINSGRKKTNQELQEEASTHRRRRA